MRDRWLLQEGYTPMLTHRIMSEAKTPHRFLHPAPPLWVMETGGTRHFLKHLRSFWRLLVWPGDLPVAVDHLHQQPGGQEHQQDVHGDLGVEGRGVWAGCGAQKQQGTRFILRDSNLGNVPASAEKSRGDFSSRPQLRHSSALFNDMLLVWILI